MISMQLSKFRISFCAYQIGYYPDEEASEIKTALHYIHLAVGSPLI